jgi:hypothetical protein
MRGLCLALLLACSDSSGTPSGVGASSGGAPDAGRSDAVAPTDAATACPRVLAPADGVRAVVVSHPFAADGKKDKRFELMSIASDGTLRTKIAAFEMGYAFDRHVVFTPDGRVGMVAQDDGSVGVFEVTADASGPTQVRVLQAAFREGFSAGKIAINAAGDKAYILDNQTANNGGGIYEATIGCDGSLRNTRKITEAQAVGAMAWIGEGKLIASAGSAFGETMTDTHVVDLRGVAPVLQGKLRLFSEQTIASSIATSPDGQVAIVACGNGFAGGNQVAVLGYGNGELSKKSVLMIESPQVVVASPFGNAFMVGAADPDNLFALRYDAANPQDPVTNKGVVSYKFPKPMLPSLAVVVDRGTLKGRILVGENTAIRQLQFTVEGAVVDTARTVLPDGTEEIVGAIGVAL